MRHGAELGALIANSRRVAGLTQRELAELAGVGLGTVRDVEQGRRPASRSAAKLATALGLDPARIAGGLTATPGPGRLTGGGHGPRLLVLGPLGAWRGGAPVELGPPRQRAVLGLLAVSPGELVRRESIIDALWGDDPPATAVNLVQAYVSRLRRALEPAGSPRDAEALLASVAGSYRLNAAACELDLLAFRQITGHGRTARSAGDALAACGLYEEALGLWRGEPLADIDLLQSHPAVAELLRRREAAVLEHGEAASAAGCPDRALPWLEALARDQPLNERAHALLMITLAAAGRQDAALKVHEELRQRLDDQLGVRPGPELAEAHLRVLRQELPGVRYSRLPPPAPAAGETAPRAVPRQLPATVPHFTGRAGELEKLTALLSEPTGAGTAGALLISAIGGAAGVGKTALAVHWAHQLAGRFPDGQLYVNLRGYDPGQPVTAAQALSGFVAALGVAGQDIRPDEDALAAQYRSLLAGRRVLVILDNAGSAQQVRPLLPGSPSCAVVVTSRDALPGLVARDGAQRLDLDVLSQADAVGLLRRLIGERADADPRATAELARQCSKLPLALRVAAELAVARPEASIADLVAELADQHRRLDVLEVTGDPRTAVRTVFSWSHENLDGRAARAFRLTALHPGPDLDQHAVAALTGTTLEQAGRSLGVLVRTHLVRADGRDRYGMHDLLRAYARELAAAHDPEAARREAMTRLFDHYQHTAAAAMETLYPAERHRRPAVPPALSPAPAVSTAASARAWLDAQRACLVAATACAANDGWPANAIRLADTLYRYLDAGGYHQEGAAIHSSACAAARQTGDREAEAGALTGLGIANLRQGRYSRAADYLEEALSLYRDAGDQTGQARAQTSLGIISFQQGRYSRAAALLGQALSLHREAGDKTGQAHALNNLSLIDLRQGRYSSAAARLGRALALCRESGNPTAEAYALANLGCAYLRQGEHQRAVDHLQQALTLCRKTGDPAGQAHALTNLGDASRQQHAHELASRYHQQALALCREVGDRSTEAEALNGLGESLLAAGQPDAARAQHATALDLARQIGDKYQQARACSGIAGSCLAAGDRGQAARHWQQALAFYAEFGSPEATRLRRQLAGLTD